MVFPQRRRRKPLCLGGTSSSTSMHRRLLLCIITILVCLAPTSTIWTVLEESQMYQQQPIYFNETLIIDQQRLVVKAKTNDRITTVDIPVTDKSTLSRSSSSSDSRPNQRKNIQIIQQEYVDYSNTKNQNFRIDYFDSKMPGCYLPLDPYKADVSMTLVTQFTLDRLWIMRYQCQRWPVPHPISIAIYLPPPIIISSPSESDHNESPRVGTPEKYVLDQLEYDFKCNMDRMFITFLKGSVEKIMEDEYPVNELRNLALENVSTTYAAYIDSDFVISEGLYDDLMTTARRIANSTTPTVINIPAFEYLSACVNKQSTNVTSEQAIQCLQSEWEQDDDDNNVLPKNQKDLVQLLDRKEYPKIVKGLDGSNNNNLYHSTTMYKHWLTHNTSAYIPCFKSDVYEPYLAFRVCNQLPKFEPLLRGYGWNKVLWMDLLLKKLGYHIIQIPNSFILHIPHPKSLSLAKRQRNRANGIGRPKEMERYYKWFTKTLKNSPNKLPTCAKRRKRIQKQQQQAQEAI